MTLSPTTETPRRRLIVVGVVALASISLALLAGYVLLAAPQRILASQGAPEPVTLGGRVVDPAGKPLRGASVMVGSLLVQTDAEGRYTIGPLGIDRSALVRMPGYAKERLALEGKDQTVTLRPHPIKAAYLTYYGIADKGIRERVFDLLGRTELNAVVIDVKGDRGLIPYRTQVPAALAAGALGPVIMKDFDQILADLKRRNVYTIARIVSFKENVLANARPELAIIDTRTGKPWMDNEKLAWVDPTREEVWDYLIAVAKEAALKGFDEIQFDYVRFPTDGKLGAAKYSKPITPQVRIETIAAFLAKAKRELAPTGAFVGADIFGYTAFNDNDTDIGQRIEDLAPHVDYLSPMVYPSGYHLGIPGYRNPVQHSYEIVRESVRLTRKRTEGLPVQIRPWIQDFKDYAFDKRIFGVTEIRDQMRGADDAGGAGWMLWNPRNDYTAAALRPANATLAKKSPATSQP
ncbi:MAG TPA: putative glycoside hydrolase [Methylomirabilota bacterium]|nr:putative glycoside hydrolase [Methylomirabilota bacterium]